MCCWLPSSPGLDPKLPPWTFIWFEAADFLAGNPPRLTLRTQSHLVAPCNCNHVCKGAGRLRSAVAEIYKSWEGSTYAQTIAHTSKNLRYSPTCRHSCTSHPALLPSAVPLDWQCPLLQGIMVENRGRGWEGLGLWQGWRGLRLGWGRVRKRAGGLGPLSFINLNVYTSWSPAMRPLFLPTSVPLQESAGQPALPPVLQSQWGGEDPLAPAGRLLHHHHHPQQPGSAITQLWMMIIRGLEVFCVCMSKCVNERGIWMPLYGPSNRFWFLLSF